MDQVACDVLVVGGGLGGVAAAMAAADHGLKVILTEETEWIGGQLTSQAVPPDEHRFIEKFGCSLTYRTLRDRLRHLYKERSNIRPDLPGAFNPGSGWVSAITARPDMWHKAIESLIAPYAEDGSLQILLGTTISGGALLSNPPSEVRVVFPKIEDDSVRSVTLENLNTGQLTEVRAKFFIDATELGDLLPLTGTQYVTGAEDRTFTGEAHGPAQYQPWNQQAFTWVFAMGHEPGANHVGEKPEGYEEWREFQPRFWPGPLLDLQDLDPITNQPRIPPLPLFADNWRSWFKYRQIIDPDLYSPPMGIETTIVNWPQNDYFLGPIVDVDPETRWERLQQAKQLSRCLLYYLQTDCPRPEGGTGYPGLFMAPESMGTEDGFALTPYIRESRRIVAKETILESHIATDSHPDRALPPHVKNSVGVGSYRIDLHPSTGGDPYIDLATLPFQIPLGALVPVRTKNLIPACKNIGSTHITNGCYRLHPVEWNIGEAAGHLAAFCAREGITPADVYDSKELTAQFQTLLVSKGVEIEWPEERMGG